MVFPRLLERVACPRKRDRLPAVIRTGVAVEEEASGGP